MNLKPFYDAAMASVAEKQGVVQQIEALFAEGKRDEALALQPTLEATAAKSKADTEFYNSLLAASGDSDTPRNFVKAGAADQTTDPAKKQMTRNAFVALDPYAKMTFIRAQGVVVDEVPND